MILHRSDMYSLSESAVTDKMKKILCIGIESDHLHLRCEVLSKSGYEARWASFCEAERLLSREIFDLLVLSVDLSEQQRSQILEFVGGRMAILEIYGTIFPQELLRQVNYKLARARISA